MATPRPDANGSKNAPKQTPADAKPKKKLVLDINDVDSILERKISP